MENEALAKQNQDWAAEVDVSQQAGISALRQQVERLKEGEQFLRWLLSIADNSKDRITANGRLCVRVAVPVAECERIKGVLGE